MKQLHIAFGVIALCGLAGCATSPTPAPATRGFTYEYAAQLVAMPSCAAKVETIFPCYARLIADDGTVLHVGSPGASLQVVGFVHSLEEGKTYSLPDAFMEYQKPHGNEPSKADASDGK